MYQTIGQVRSGIAARATTISRAALQYEIQAADQAAADALSVVEAVARRGRRTPTLADRDIARTWIDAVLVATEWRVAAEQRDAGRRAAA